MNIPTTCNDVEESDNEDTENEISAEVEEVVAVATDSKGTAVNV